MELTDKQKEELRKLNREHIQKCTIASFLYCAWLLASNFFLVIINELYVKDKNFLFFSALGTAVIIFAGLLGTVDEISNDIMQKAKKVMENKD